MLPTRTLTLAAVLLLALAPLARGADKGQSPPLVRSAKSGSWSAADTWEGGKTPAAGAKVQVRAGHRVIYDVQSDAAIRSLHVAGTLTFDPGKDTRLDVGLIKVQAGDDASEDGFDCDAHLKAPEAGKPRPALEVGTPDAPIEAKHTAVIRLVSFDGMEKDSCPAVVCCGGRMDFHGTPLSRTWVKLGATAKAGDNTVTLAEAVTGWRVGDRLILTATTRQNKQKKTFRNSVRDNTQTEERVCTLRDFLQHEIAVFRGISRVGGFLGGFAEPPKRAIIARTPHFLGGFRRSSVRKSRKVQSGSSRASTARRSRSTRRSSSTTWTAATTAARWRT